MLIVYIAPDHVHWFIGTIYTSYNGYFQHDGMWFQCGKSQCTNCLKLVPETWQRVQCTLMASPATRSDSNRAPLGCGKTGDSQYEHAADKSAGLWRDHVNMDQFPARWRIHHKEPRLSWVQTGVLPSIIFLIAGFLCPNLDDTMYYILKFNFING